MNTSYKSIIGNNYILDESKNESRPKMVDTGNLIQEYFSQTKGVLSLNLDIKSIVKESKQLSDSEERCAMAGLLSTNLSFKLAEETPQEAKVKDATFDIDNVSVSGVIAKELLFDNFNNSCDEPSSKLSSLELTNTVGVGMLLAHFLSLFEHGFKDDGGFLNLMKNQCHLEKQKLVLNPRNFTHIKKANKYNHTFQIPSEGIFGTSICRFAVSYHSKETGKNISISLFNYFDYDHLFLFHFFIFYYYLFVQYQMSNN
jgi:hypothetical protein